MSQIVDVNGAVGQIFAIDQELCIRCASCSSIAPTIFYVGDDTAYILRQPLDAEEVDQCEAAVGNCPTSAISAPPKSSLVEITARS